MPPRGMVADGSNVWLRIPHLLTTLFYTDGHDEKFSTTSLKGNSIKRKQFPEYQRESELVTDMAALGAREAFLINIYIAKKMFWM